MSVWKKLTQAHDWPVPKGWRRLTTLDMHTEGEPLRVVLAGFPEVEGQNILEYRSYVKDNWDFLRTALMWEPRGHADMYGCLITPAVREDSDFGVLFLHNEGYSSMCGHAIIALAKLVVEMGWIQREEPQTMVKIDAPAGQIVAWVKVIDQQVRSVSFHNVPSFVSALGETVAVPGIGEVAYDLAYGGAFYAYVNADQLGISLAKENVSQLIPKGMAIKRAVMAESKAIVHPYEADLSFLYGTIFYGEASRGSHADSRNVCIFAEGEVDRSPTGTGVSGRMALHHAKGELAVGETMKIESIIGSAFTAKIVDTALFGPHQAVIPEVEGNAYITGRHEFLIDPNDPLQKGFLLR